MRCFYHGDVEAVALCKSCGHAICHECCADVDRSAACRNRCEADVLALNEIIERSKTAYQKTGGAYTRSGVFLIVLGLVFAGIGAIGFLGDGEPVYFLLIMGFLFAFYGITQIFTGRRFRAK